MNDKTLHFLVSMLLSAAIGLGAAVLCLGIWVSLVAAFMLTMLVGTIKELRDMQQEGNHFCLKDLAADAAGATAGCILAAIPLLINYLIKCG